jgi:hypothetical protein
LLSLPFIYANPPAVWVRGQNQSAIFLPHNTRADLQLDGMFNSDWEHKDFLPNLRREVCNPVTFSAAIRKIAEYSSSGLRMLTQVLSKRQSQKSHFRAVFLMSVSEGYGIDPLSFWRGYSCTLPVGATPASHVADLRK